MAYSQRASHSQENRISPGLFPLFRLTQLVQLLSLVMIVRLRFESYLIVSFALLVLPVSLAFV